MRVASGLFSSSMAAGLLAFSSRQFALTTKNGPSLCPLHTIFLPGQASVAGGACRPRSEAPCILYTYAAARSHRAELIIIKTAPAICWVAVTALPGTSVPKCSHHNKLQVRSYEPSSESAQPFSHYVSNSSTKIQAVVTGKVPTTLEWKNTSREHAR